MKNLTQKKHICNTFLLKNNSKKNKELSISPVSRWNLAQTSIINKSGEIIKLTDTGFFVQPLPAFMIKNLLILITLKVNIPFI